MKNKIKFAFLGFGRIATKHFNVLNSKKINNAEIVAICEKDQSKLSKFKIPKKIKIYQNLNKMIRNEKIDVISILTESGNHFRHIKQVSKFKKHIVVEKPICMNSNQLSKVIKISKQNKIKIFAVMQNRYNLPIKLLKKNIDKKKFGKIVLATVRVRWSRTQKYYNLDKWRGTCKYDGGALNNQGIHHIDLLTWLAGEVESVFCKTATQLVKIEAEDTAVAVLKFKNKALGAIEITTATRPKDTEGSISILGKKGMVEIGGFAANKILHWNFKGKNNDIIKNKFFQNPKNVYGFGHLEFYKKVISNLKFNTKAIMAVDAMNSLKILDALYKSARLNKEVKVN